LTLAIGTVFRWDHFPLPRYGDEIKPRWFIYLGETGPFSQIAIIYIATTTTQKAPFEAGGERCKHDIFRFDTKQFPEFEENCILDFDEAPHAIGKEKFLKATGDVVNKGTLKETTLRMIYNRFLQSGSCSKMIMQDIHDSYNKAGIAGLKKPK
jgi:hypothetical protein